MFVCVEKESSQERRESKRDFENRTYILDRSETGWVTWIMDAVDLQNPDPNIATALSRRFGYAG